jgi:hypothetical protein
MNPVPTPFYTFSPASATTHKISKTQSTSNLDRDVATPCMQCSSLGEKERWREVKSEGMRSFVKFRPLCNKEARLSCNNHIELPEMPS